MSISSAFIWGKLLLQFIEIELNYVFSVLGWLVSALLLPPYLTLQ
jgi:hypothetical protein